MKIMRWLLGAMVLLFVVFLLVGSSPLMAGEYSSQDCDEHPWDIFKFAYKVEILVVTQDYIILAVWYTREQEQPIIVRINLRSSETGKVKARIYNSFFYTD